jgi:DNA-binding NarL/FixJ family response regulator
MAANDDFPPEVEEVQIRLGNLTEREREVLALIVAGKSNSEIAWALRITPNTAKAHVASIIRKLGVASRTEAAVMWVREQYGRL